MCWQNNEYSHTICIVICRHIYAKLLESGSFNVNLLAIGLMPESCLN